MIKCVNKGKYTCINKTGLLKKAYVNQVEAISAAKTYNTKFPKVGAKLVAYKCIYCFKYHLTTRFKVGKHV